MKKIICFLLSLTVVFAFLCSCDIDRKLEGVEMKFKQKIESATELSFSAHLKTEADGKTKELNIDCFKNAGEYSYEFNNPNNASSRYRRLYADNKLYEFIETSGQAAGTYSVTDNVSIDANENLLRQIEKNIMLATYATLLLDGKKETFNGAEVYRYDLDVDGNTYTLWYDDTYLIKIAAVINTTDGEGKTTSDYYEAIFSDYKFENVDKTPFERPGALYVESPVEIEDWIGIICDFSDMSINWMK